MAGIPSPNTTCERKVKATGKLIEQDPRMSGGGGDAGTWNARCEREAVAAVDCHMSERKMITHAYPRCMQNTKIEVMRHPHILVEREPERCFPP